MTTTLSKSPLRPCPGCSGCGRVRDEVLGAPATTSCPQCEGGRLAPGYFDLGPTASYVSRRVVWNPGIRKLFVWRAKSQSSETQENYLVAEYRPDLLKGERASRAWRLTKESTGEVYYAKTGGHWHSCDCKGFEARSTAKANDRAWSAGEMTTISFGCVHLDALIHLLAGGWLDIPEV